MRCLFAENHSKPPPPFLTSKSTKKTPASCPIGTPIESASLLANITLTASGSRDAASRHLTKGTFPAHGKQAQACATKTAASIN
jgi:hypothetical protein